jgi:hypothetical protein
MDRHLAAKMHRLSVADLANSPLGAISALNRHILIDNPFCPDLFSVPKSEIP